MPDFNDIEKEAESHSKEVDEAIDKGTEEADNATGGKDDGMIDKGGKEAENLIENGGQASPTSPS